MTENCCKHGPGYASPSEAINGPREKVLFIACPCSYPDKGNDAIVVVDVDPQSTNYSKVINKLLLPNKGDEVHHYGWNTCSSCFNCKDERRTHLLFPCLNSSRVYVVNAEVPTMLKIDKIIEPDELFKYDVSYPHTSHCAPDGQVMISTLGDKDGKEKCDFVLIDNKKFEVTGTWLNRDENDKENPMFNYDFWYQPRRNLMVSTEWGTPNSFLKGFSPFEFIANYYGSSVHVYNWNERKKVQTIKLEGEAGQLPFEVRFHHNPDSPHVFYNSVIGSALHHMYQESEDKLEMKHRVAVKIPKKTVTNWTLPLLPAMITDIVISMDDKYLFCSCWFHGDVRMYDITDPFDFKLVGQCFVGGLIHKESGRTVLQDDELDEQPDAAYIQGKRIEGGPQMSQLSLDGKRLYVTTSLYRSWDEQFYPDMIKNGATLFMLDVDNDPNSVNSNRLTLNTDFGVDFSNLFDNGIPYLAHEIRYPGGDCTSDIWC